MASRTDKLIGVRVAAAAHDFLEMLANESDRTVAGLTRRLLYERLNQIAAERQQSGSFTDTTGGRDTAIAA